jgi:uncharacterized protein YceK
MMSGKGRVLSGVVLILSSVLLFSGCSAVNRTHADAHMDHDHAASATMANAEPETQEWAKQRLAQNAKSTLLLSTPK